MVSKDDLNLPTALDQFKLYFECQMCMKAPDLATLPAVKRTVKAEEVEDDLVIRYVEYDWGKTRA